MVKYPTLEEDLVNLQKAVNKPLSEIVYYNNLSLKEKTEYIDNLYQKAKKEMFDPTDKYAPNIDMILNTHMKCRNIEDAKDMQKHSCFCCGIGIVKKYWSSSYLLTPHRIVYDCMKGDYVPQNIVMLCHKCHEKEFNYWNKNKKRLQTLIVIRHKYGTSPRIIPLPWEELIDISFDIFKEFIEYNHKRTDEEIESCIDQEIENDIDIPSFEDEICC